MPLELIPINVPHTSDNRIWWGTITVAAEIMSWYFLSGPCCDITLICKHRTIKNSEGIGPNKNQYQFVQQMPKVQSLKDFDAKLGRFPEEQERTPLPKEILKDWRIYISQLHTYLPKYLYQPPSCQHPYFNMRDQVEQSISLMLQLCRPSNQALGLRFSHIYSATYRRGRTLSKLPWRLFDSPCMFSAGHS